MSAQDLARSIKVVCVYLVDLLQVIETADVYAGSAASLDDILKRSHTHDMALVKDNGSIRQGSGNFRFLG